MMHCKFKCLASLLILPVLFLGCGQIDSKDDFEPVKPAATIEFAPGEDPTAVDLEKPDPAGEAIRKRSLAILTKGGFEAVGSLPTAGHRRGVAGKLRSTREIAQRLMALNALFIWASAPEEAIGSREVMEYVKRNGLREHLTEKESAILSLPRTKALEQHAGSVGWRLENMWSLAWVLGFEMEPNPMLGQIPEEITRALVMEFLPGLDSSVEDLLKKTKPRALKEVQELEDVFYCSHNAVRSAQMGSKTVPAGFHPVNDGGAIHERRHALTWTLSPEIEWDDTDLST